MREDPEGYRTYVATGAPVTFRQKRDKVDDWIEGFAQRAEFDDRNDLLRLYSGARLKSAQGELTGDFISYDRGKEFFEVTGAAPGAPASPGSRVKATHHSPEEGRGRQGRGASRPAPRDPPARQGPRDGAVSTSAAAQHLTLVKSEAKPAVLRAEALMKRYKKRVVVSDVSLTVESGEVVGLLGPNGAGKTTCFYMILGLVPVDQGSIRLDGQDVTHLPIYRRSRLGLSYLPQEASIFRRLNVAQNIQAVLELQGLEDEEIEARLESLLDDLHIGHLRASPAISLSGGERRRVEIARALATSPRFILLDEPFAGVDPIAVLDIQQIIRFLKDRGIGVLITDHNVRETLGICDHAYIINQGSVLAFGKPEEIIYNEDVRKVYLGENFRL